MGLPLPEVGVTQTVFPSVFFMCTTGTLSPSTVCKSSDWAGPARLADPLVLTNHVAFAKCVCQYLNVPAPIALNVVFNIVSFDFPGGWCMIGDAIYPLNAMFFGPSVYEVVSEMSPVVLLSSFWGAMLP